MIESAEEFVRCRDSQIPEEYHRASHEPATMDVWMDVIARYPDMREWVAHNKTVPHEILAILAVDPDERVRYTVAGKRQLLPETMLVLSRDPDQYIRAFLLDHPKITPEVLAILADDPSPWVRNEIARREAEATGLPYDDPLNTNTYEPPPETSAPPLEPSEARRLTDAWTAHWPGTRLVGHELRVQLPDHWFRFDGLPGSQRYAETQEDYAEIRRRLDAVIAALTKDSDQRLLVLTASYSDSADGPVPERWGDLPKLLPDSHHWSAAPRAVDPGETPVWTHLFVDRLRLDDPTLQRFLRWVADGNGLDVVLADEDFQWLIAPYDGGADVIAPTMNRRNQLAATFGDWLPTTDSAAHLTLGPSPARS